LAAAGAEVAAGLGDRGGLRRSPLDIGLDDPAARAAAGQSLEVDPGLLGQTPRQGVAIIRPPFASGAWPLTV